MAYYAPFYRPTYYDPVQQNQMGQYNPQYQQPMGQFQNQQPVRQNNGGFVWIQGGEAGAKSYLVAPGETVMLMDELVEAVKILHPRMYTTFIDKVQDL